MTAAAIALPPLPPCVVLQPSRDAASNAVLRYFEGAEVQGDAFEHLLAICLKSIGRCFLPEQDGIGTRHWIEQWLSRFLTRYRGRTRDELILAAEHDEFRYIGRKCRLRLIDTLRRRMAKKNVNPPHVYLSDPVGQDEDGNELTLLDRLGTTRPDAPSCLARGISFEEFLESIAAAFRAVAAHQEGLARLDLLDGLHAILSNAEYLEHESSRSFHARIVKSIAAMRKVSVRAAADYICRFNATVAREMKAANPAVKALYADLQTQPTPHYGVIDEINPKFIFSTASSHPDFTE